MSVAVLLIATEYVFVYVSESWGILLSLASALAIYGLMSVLELSQDLIEVLEDFTLLFLYIMLVSSLPWFFLRQDLLVPAAYSVVLALCFWRIRSRNSSIGSLGLSWRGFISNALIGIVAGVPAGAIEYYILTPLPATPAFDALQFLQTTVYMFFFVGLGEELLFRALIQRSIVNLVGAGPGILWSGLTFAAMHTVWRSVPELFFTFVAGLALGLLYHKTRNLVGPIFLHATNNIVLLAIMPYLA